jgi:molybdate transport system substrate-binding protein
MDYLSERHLIVQSSRRDLLGNRLVLVGPHDGSLTADLFRLPAELGESRLAMGDPESVPAGRYAKAALVSLGLWEALADRVVGTKDVRAALALVERGEVRAGIVYLTDALASRNVRVVLEIPEGSHPPIVYPLAIVAGADNARTRAAYDFLLGPVAREVFLAKGFAVTGAAIPAN